MKKNLAFAFILLVAAVIIALDFHRGVRIKHAVSGLLPVDTVELITFRSTAPDGRWVVVEKDDAHGLLRAYNANRQLLAEHVTPFLPFGGPRAPDMAPIAIMRMGGAEHEWHLVPRNDRLLDKYLGLSTAPATTPGMP